MSEKNVEKFTKLLNSKRISILALSIIIIIFIGLILFQGLIVTEAYSTCQKKVKKCHGIPLTNSCIGPESEQTSIVEKDKCDFVDDISQKCDRLADEICSINSNPIGESWAEKTDVYGQNCRTWSEEYNIDLRSC